MGKLCSGFQIHVDHPQFKPSEFKPYRLIALLLKATRSEFSDFDLWKQPPYEYEEKLMPFDILSGSSFLRAWVEDETAGIGDLEERLSQDEREWATARADFLIYS